MTSVNFHVKATSFSTLIKSVVNFNVNFYKTQQKAGLVQQTTIEQRTICFKKE